MNFTDFIDYIRLKYLIVPKAPAIEEGKKHLACIGDSITFGAGVNGQKENTWPHFLQEKLGSAYQVLNYGINGRTLQSEGDFPYREDRFFQLSKQLRADIYLIMLGSNDSKPQNWNEERYARELKSFLQEYQEAAQIKVVVLTPPSCFVDRQTGVVGYEIDKSVVDGPLYQITKETARSLDLPLIDLHAFTDGHEEWFADGVHPNKEGNRQIAEFIFANIQGLI